jgi:hypothetical protein
MLVAFIIKPFQPYQRAFADSETGSIQIPIRNAPYGRRYQT